MKIFIRLFIFFFMLTLLSSGCAMRIHRDYSFTVPSSDIVGGTVYAKLRGTMRNVDDNNSVSGKPYDLLIWFSMSEYGKDDSCTVKLSSLSLKNIENNTAIPIVPIASANFKVKRNGRYSATILIKKLELEYAVHELDFEYSIVIGCATSNAVKPIKLEFKKDYQERKVSFWDSLMGI